MANNTPTTVTNALDLQYPRDPYGFTTLLRKEGARAVGRLSGSDEKYDIFIETLKVLGKYAKDKLALQKTIKAADLNAAEAAAAAEALRRTADQELELARLHKLAAQIQDQIAANTPEAAPEVAAE